jgi:hypothetical protein
VDDDPFALFAHATRYVLVDTVTEEVTVLEKWWPPAINGAFPWSHDADREDPANWAYSHLTEWPPAGPTAVSAEQLAAGASGGRVVAAGTQDGLVLVNGWSPGQADNGDMGKNITNGQDWAEGEGVGNSTAGPPGGLVGVRAAIQEQVHKGADDIFLYIVCHGDWDEHGKLCLNINGEKVTTADLCKLFAEFPGVDFKVAVDACHSGWLVEQLIGCGPVAIAITSCTSGEVAYGDQDPKDQHGANVDRNPEDTGTEFSSGLWHDLKQIMGDPKQLKAAEKLAAEQKIPRMAGILRLAFNSALRLDVNANLGRTHPRVKIHQK